MCCVVVPGDEAEILPEILKKPAASLTYSVVLTVPLPSGIRLIDEVKPLLAFSEISKPDGAETVSVAYRLVPVTPKVVGVDGEETEQLETRGFTSGVVSEIARPYSAIPK
jgi:hypothetical protein